MFTASILVGIVNFFIGLAEAILGLRVIFRLFNANGTSSFVHWIYQTSGTLMDPFRNIFRATATISPGYVLDINALFAMLMYAIIGYLIAALLGWVPLPAARTRRWGLHRRDVDVAPTRRRA
jgi:uncharacterized protein YggT (Ycf19 family)